MEALPDPQSYWGSLKEISPPTSDSDKELEAKTKEFITNYGIQPELDNAFAEADPDGVKRFSHEQLNYYTKNYKKNISSGGFGDVFKGWIVHPDGNIRQTVAVKVSRSASKTYIRQWKRELEYLPKMDHQNIIKLIGYGGPAPPDEIDDNANYTGDTKFCLVYEYMKRGSVSSNLKTLDWTSTKQIAIGSAQAMSFLHSRRPPLIYRDFKCSNIVLDENNFPKLIDFGTVTEQNQVLVAGTNLLTDRGTMTDGIGMKERDIFSMGMLLLQLLTKKLDYTHLKVMARARFAENLSIVHEALKDGGCTDAQGTVMTQLALDCLRDDITQRPPIEQVVKVVEDLLPLDEDDN